MFHGPLQFRVWEKQHPDTQELIAINMFLGTYQQRRTIWMDGRPHPPEYAPHTWMGFSTGVFNGDIADGHDDAPQGRVTSGAAACRAATGTTLVEHYVRYGNVLSHVTIATDPVYLTEPFIRSQEFVRMERGNQNWLYNCEYAMEIPRPPRGAAFPARDRTRVSTEFGAELRHAAGGRARRRADTAGTPESSARGKGPTPAACRARGAHAVGRARPRPASVPAGEVRGGARAGQRPHAGDAGATSPCRLGRTACSSSIPAAPA